MLLDLGSYKPTRRMTAVNVTTDLLLLSMLLLRTVSLRNLHDASRDLARVMIEVRVRVRSEIWKLHTRDCEIVQRILQIEQIDNSRATSLSPQHAEKWFDFIWVKSIKFFFVHESYLFWVTFHLYSSAFVREYFFTFTWLKIQVYFHFPQVMNHNTLNKSGFLWL